VLGFLSLRDWTPYELAENMRRNFRFFCARADSVLYDEPKRLARKGYARASRDRVGARRRTTYSITPKGSSALRAWLETPCAPPQLDAESVVRVFFARQGTPADLASAFSQARALADDIQGIGRVVAREFLAGKAPHQQQPHLNAIVFDFLWGWAEHLRGWADRWDAETRSWSDVEVDRRKQGRAEAVFRAAMAGTPGA
jgi:DNA-binding PadR family transcriptional regulator